MNNVPFTFNILCLSYLVCVLYFKNLNKKECMYVQNIYIFNKFVCSICNCILIIIILRKFLMW